MLVLPKRAITFEKRVFERLSFQAEHANYEVLLHATFTHSKSQGPDNRVATPG